MHKFVPNYAKVAKPFYKLLKKDVKFEWDDQGKKSFKEIKASVSKSHVLIRPDYSKDFKIFSFASEDTIAGVLLQTNDQGQYQPIAYLSRALQDSELKYHTVEKQAYALVIP